MNKIAPLPIKHDENGNLYGMHMGVLISSRYPVDQQLDQSRADNFESFDIEETILNEFDSTDGFSRSIQLVLSEAHYPEVDFNPTYQVEEAEISKPTSAAAHGVVKNFQVDDRHRWAVQRLASYTNGGDSVETSHEFYWKGKAQFEMYLAHQKFHDGFEADDDLYETHHFKDIRESVFGAGADISKGTEIFTLMEEMASRPEVLPSGDIRSGAFYDRMSGDKLLDYNLDNGRFSLDLTKYAKGMMGNSDEKGITFDFRTSDVVRSSDALMEMADRIPTFLKARHEDIVDKRRRDYPRMAAKSFEQLHDRLTNSRIGFKYEPTSEAKQSDLKISTYLANDVASYLYYRAPDEVKANLTRRDRINMFALVSDEKGQQSVIEKIKNTADKALEKLSPTKKKISEGVER